MTPKNLSPPDGPVCFIVPGPPVPTARTRSTRNGTHYNTKRTRDYRARVKLHALAEMKHRPPLKGELLLIANFKLPDRRRRDLDNLVKGVKDAMNGIVWDDDSQVVAELVTKKVDKENTGARIWVARSEDYPDQEGTLWVTFKEPQP